MPIRPRSPQKLLGTEEILIRDDPELGLDASRCATPTTVGHAATDVPRS